MMTTNLLHPILKKQKPFSIILKQSTVPFPPINLIQQEVKDDKLNVQYNNTLLNFKMMMNTPHPLPHMNLPIP